MNEGQIERVFSALGRIEQKIDGHTMWMINHVAEDAKMAADIKALQMSGARQRGFTTAVAAVGAAVGTGVGWLVQFLVHRN